MIFHVVKWQLVNKDFTETAVDSHNYLPQVMNIGILLTTKLLIDNINKSNPKAHVSDITKYNTLLLET